MAIIGFLLLSLLVHLSESKFCTVFKIPGLFAEPGETSGPVIELCGTPACNGKPECESAVSVQGAPSLADYCSRRYPLGCRCEKAALAGSCGRGMQCWAPPIGGNVKCDGTTACYCWPLRYCDQRLLCPSGQSCFLLNGMNTCIKVA